MKLTITKLFLTAVLGWLPLACGSVVNNQVLNIEMYGVSKAPAAATGDKDPHYEIYQVLSVVLVSEDGTTLTKLFDNDEERIYRIVDRSQIIYSKKIQDLVGTTYSALQVTFDPKIEGAESGAASSFTMTSPTQVLTKTFTIENAKDVTALIKINWGNTMVDGVVTEPEYLLSFE